MNTTDTTPATQSTAAQIRALNRRITALAAELAQTRLDVADQIRVAVDALRAELRREVVTEHLAVVDGQQRVWIETVLLDEAASIRVAHPDEDLELAATIGVSEEFLPGVAYVHVGNAGQGSELTSGSGTSWLGPNAAVPR